MVFELVNFEDVKDITAEEYFSDNALAVDAFNAKYAFDKEASTKETPAEVFMRVAEGLAQYEDEDKRDYYRDWWFTLMWLGWFRPGGSVIAGVGSDKKISLINCTTIPLEEDSLKGIISDSEYWMAKCASMRQGLGADLSNLRPKGAPINNAAKYSDGVVSWATKLSELGRFVGQRGRMPAILLSLKVDHPDVEDFIVSKTDLKAIVNANISVQITDEFMEAYENDEDWELKFEFKDNLYPPITRTVKARDLMDLIAKTAFDTAEPGIQLIDSMRRGSMVHQVYEATGDDRFKVISSNACCFTEQNQILTDKGSITIAELRERISSGEILKALSKNIDADTLEYKDIVNVFVRENGKPVTTVNVHVSNGSTLECTPDHKFYVFKKGLVEAQNLIESDYLFNSDNNIVKVEKVEFNTEKKPTFNIEVEDNHNYFVGGILVKNSEKPLPKFSCCNLLSPNFEMFSTDPKEYKEQLEFIVPFLVRLSDNVVTYEIENKKYPLEQQAFILNATREIGLGMTNLHGWFLKQDIAYDSDEAIKVAEEFFSYYAYQTFKASKELGKEKGSAPAWDMVEDKSFFMKSIYFKNIVDKYFDGDYTKITHMRNMAHMSIAPSGSISLVFPKPVVSTGVEPMYAPAYWKRTRAIKQGVYTHYFTVPPRVKEYVLSKLKDPEDETGLDQSEDYLKLKLFPGSKEDNDGSIGTELKNIIDRAVPKGFFKAAHEINPLQKVKLMGKLYKWIDAAVSCTYNLPRTATVEDVKSIYVEAYKAGVRAVSVYVEGSREGILITDDPVTYAKKYSKTVEGVCSDRPLTIAPTCAPKRPKELPCDIHHTSVKGEMFLVMVGLMDGHPFEVFAGPSEDLYLPKSCNEGIITKEGGGKYALHVTIRRSPVVYQDLASVLMSDDQKALTRLLSLSLRHGVPPKFIVEQLKKSNGNITAFSTAVARVLSKYIGTFNLEGDESKCPECGENSLIFTEGCIKCANDSCNYSRCG